MDGRSRCPVKHSSSSSQTSSSSSIESSPWGNWFRKTNSSQHQNMYKNEQQNSNRSASTGSGSCPIQNGSISSIEEAARHAQTPQPDQTIPLSTHRTISSIPKGNTNNDTSSNPTPNHQPTHNSNWVYPSEQQFFNAMKRKGWEIPPGTEATIPFVVQIHNAVNERGWKEIREWENLRSNEDPKLVKFIGRPQDLSPKARIYSMLWLRKEPFDRHDWYVSREDGTDMRRYVIDFYNGKEKDVSDSGVNDRVGDDDHNSQMKNLSLPSMYLDVRPALDDSDAAFDRLKMSFKDTFPGIASVLFKPS